MSDVELDYADIMDGALRRVVDQVLRITQQLGAAPGEHHFYLEFLTQADGVEIPDYLRDTYPERMTIVLQHQFKDLYVDDEGFSVTLWFKGEPAALKVPYDALTTFADPSVQFELRFNAALAAQTAQPPASDSAARMEGVGGQPASAAVAEPNDDDGRSAEVVSLDAFRKK